MNQIVKMPFAILDKPLSDAVLLKKLLLQAGAFLANPLVYLILYAAATLLIGACSSTRNPSGTYTDGWQIWKFRTDGTAYYEFPFTGASMVDVKITSDGNWWREGEEIVFKGRYISHPALPTLRSEALGEETRRFTMAENGDLFYVNGASGLAGQRQFEKVRKFDWDWLGANRQRRPSLLPQALQ